MTLDRTYFATGICEVPNIAGLTRGGQTTEGRGALLDDFITRYQKEFMYKLLGKTLADEYLDAPEGDEKWKGLDAVLFDEDSKSSPVANYVFFFYWKATIVRNQGVGSVMQSAENGTLMNDQRLTDVWNQMVCMMDNVIAYIGETDLYTVDVTEALATLLTPIYL